jgi:ribosome-associated heat shock protein Hsp15
MSGTTQRIDKWLWFARITKTRSMAAALVGGGALRVNRQKITKPSHQVAPGDILTLAVGGRVQVVKVLDVGIRRGPAAKARLLYQDLNDPTPDAPAALEPQG